MIVIPIRQPTDHLISNVSAALYSPDVRQLTDHQVKDLPELQLVCDEE